MTIYIIILFVCVYIRHISGNYSPAVKYSVMYSKVEGGNGNQMTHGLRNWVREESDTLKCT